MPIYEARIQLKDPCSCKGCPFVRIDQSRDDTFLECAYHDAPLDQDYLRRPQWCDLRLVVSD
jgi:hypothetical protein